MNTTDQFICKQSIRSQDAFDLLGVFTVVQTYSAQYLQGRYCRDAENQVFQELLVVMHVQLSSETQLNQAAATNKGQTPLHHRKFHFGPVLDTALLLPVSLCGECENSLSSTGPTQQAASTEVKSSALTALLDEFLDRNRLNDRVAAEGGLLLRGQCLGRLPRLRVWVQPSWCLLRLGDGKGGLGSTISEVGVLQCADVLTHPENKQEKK